MSGLPKDVQEAIDELQKHYSDFEPNIRGANGFLYFARNRISDARVAIKFYTGEAGECREGKPGTVSTFTRFRESLARLHGGNRDGKSGRERVNKSRNIRVQSCGVHLMLRACL